jgi:RNA polymerase sigma factor FliA
LTTIDLPADDPEYMRRDVSEETLTRIVQEHMPLVRHAVNRLSTGAGHYTMLQYEDMVSCGVQGLLEAHRSYDPTRGVKFSTYALPRIRGSILDALRAAHPLPRSLQKLSSDIDRALSSLYVELGRTPTKAELADRLELPLEELLEAARATSIRVVSLERLAATAVNGATEKLNELADDDPHIDPGAVAQLRLVRTVLSSAIQGLPRREREIIRLYYIESRSLKSIGLAMAISESRTSQLRQRAIRRLRGALGPELSEAA